MDDATLKNLLTADVPPSDRSFALAVMKRIEQRRFRRELAQTAGLGAAAMALLWLLAPMVETAWQSLAPYASNVVVLLILMSLTLAVPYLLPARGD